MDFDPPNVWIIEEIKRLKHALERGGTVPQTELRLKCLEELLAYRHQIMEEEEAGELRNAVQGEQIPDR